MNRDIREDEGYAVGNWSLARAMFAIHVEESYHRTNIYKKRMWFQSRRLIIDSLPNQTSYEESSKRTELVPEWYKFVLQ